MKTIVSDSAKSQESSGDVRKILQFKMLNKNKHLKKNLVPIEKLKSSCRLRSTSSETPNNVTSPRVQVGIAPVSAPSARAR